MSRSSSSSSSSPTTETLNLGLQDIDGEAIAAVDSTVTVNATDHGAVDAAERIAVDAIGATERNLDVVTGALERGSRDAFDFGRDSIDAVGSAYRDATSSVVEGSRDALDFAGDVHLSSIDVVDRAGDRSLALADRFAGELRAAYEGVGAYVERTGGQFLETVERFQARESTNTDARLEGVTKTGLTVAGVVAAAAVLAIALR